MTTIPDSADVVNLDPDAVPFTPTEGDARRAAEAFGADATDYDFDDDLDELAALEAAAMDAIELGLIPSDTAEGLMARSIIGHVA